MILQMMVGVSVFLNGLAPLPPVEKPPVPKQFTTVKSNYELAVEKQKREEASWHQGSLTNYCNCKDKLNGETGVTANGYDLDNGIYYKGFRILASDKSIDFGTLISIRLADGTNFTGIVLDRGGAIRGSHFDMVAGSRKEALDFGRQRITFKVLGKSPL